MSVLSRLMSGKKKVIGIDASTHTLAFCYMVDGVPREWGEINYSDSNNQFVRLGSVDQRAGIVVDRYKDVDLVVIEAPVKMRNIRVAISLAYSYGIVAAKFASAGVEVKDVSPIVWQRHIGNPPLSMAEKKNIREDNPNRTKSWYYNESRRIRKQRTIDWVQSTYGIDARNDNIADAIAVAYFASRH